MLSIGLYISKREDMAAKLLAVPPKPTNNMFVTEPKPVKQDVYDISESECCRENARNGVSYFNTAAQT